MKTAVILFLATLTTVALASTEKPATTDNSTKKKEEGGDGKVDGRIWAAPGQVVYPVVHPVYPVVHPVYPVVKPVYPVVGTSYGPCRYRCSLRVCELYQCHYKCIRRSDCYGPLGELDARKGANKAEINVSRPVSQKVDAFDYTPPKP